MPFKSYKKLCKECNVQLTLNNSRDIVRKNFCGHSCRAKFYEINKHGDVSLMSTPEANAKKARKGADNGRWIDDRTALKTRKRYEGYEWRKAVFERDAYTCQDCGKVGRDLQSHHKAPYKLFSELRWEIANGITLCSKDHKKLHSAFTEIFGAISSQKGAHYAV